MVGSVGSLCFNSYGVLAPVSIFGLRGPNMVPDIDNSKTVVFWVGKGEADPEWIEDVFWTVPASTIFPSP
jgi:hypothetical protein